MSLLSPKLDIVFKSLFADEPQLLTDLLNQVMVGYGYSKVHSLTVRNPAISQQDVHEKQIALDIHALDKQIALDIHALDEAGRRFNIEMQVQRESAYAERALYYLAKLHASQLNPGESYDRLTATLGIHWLDHIFYTKAQSEHWAHCFEWRSRTQPELQWSEAMVLWVLELPKAPIAWGNTLSA